MLPFSRDRFLAVFATYNHAIWPWEIVAYVLGIIAVAAFVRQCSAASRIVAGVLALMWGWTGIAYHWLFFAQINRAAFVFGALFVVQGGFLAYAGVIRNQIALQPERGIAAWVGGGLVAYAAILYPLIGLMTGHAYATLPMFGVTPCPVTLFTFGILLFASNRLPRWLLVIPFLWSLIGGSAAVLLGIAQDWLLPVSGLIAIRLIIRHERRGIRAASAGRDDRGRPA